MLTHPDADNPATVALLHALARFAPAAEAHEPEADAARLALRLAA